MRWADPSRARENIYLSASKPGALGLELGFRRAAGVTRGAGQVHRHPSLAWRPGERVGRSGAVGAVKAGLAGLVLGLELGAESKDLFQRVDQLSAPRLVEYWEQDPCAHAELGAGFDMRKASRAMAEAPPSPAAADMGVLIEAQFTVGEHEVVILSAEDSMGLDTWLRCEKYRIPEGAEPAMRPYVQMGSKFFVAKVDVEKVKFKDGKAQLSPLRFHYDDDRFMLLVRLGLIGSSGTQDLIIGILAKNPRYEVASIGGSKGGRGASQWP